MKNKLIYALAWAMLACTVLFSGCVAKQESVQPSTENILSDKQETEAVEKEPESIQQHSVGDTDEKVAEKPKESTEKSGNFCTLSVHCETILANKDKLKKEKLAIVPEDGVIYAEKEVEFTLGESAFDVLCREMRNAKIHMEFNETPMYKSAYIEGIGNLYEFDCGELSGWTYLVNGQMKNMGCSQYILQPGDKVEFVYTCNMGRDVGGEI